MIIPAAVSFLIVRLLASATFAQDLQEAFIIKARGARLWEQREWLLLLHYKPGFRGMKSEARNPGFFLSPQGRTNPRLELEAGIRSYFKKNPADPDSDFPCRFPLRAAWIAARLELSRPSDCPKYKTWREDLRADSATLIFASAYLSNPSSMYGHTFLRIDQRAHDEKTRLLDNAVNFAANADTDNGILFAVYGLTGRFPGRFSAMPYYLKVQEYSNMESRDIWEYRLTLDTAAVDRLAAHIWEMGGAEFGYYFFNKNCSYQLLPLLEVADPRLHLTDHWPLYVIPMDTIRTVLRQPGLVAGFAYRPSQVTRLLYRRDRLNAQEIRIAEALLRPKEKRAWRDPSPLPRERQMRVLDSSAEYLQYLAGFRPKQIEESKEIRHRILVVRGKIDLPSPPDEVPAPVPPHEGHDTGRFGAGYGFGSRAFIETAIRPALHDLLDPSSGYAPGSGLEMLQLRLRHDIKADKNYLESLDLVRILSLSPYDRWIHHPSWKLDAGMRTAGELDPRPWKAGYFGLGAGSGLAAETHFLRRELAYALVEADGGFGGIFRRDYRLGGGGTAALRVELSVRWSVQAEAGYRAYALGDPRPVGYEGVESSFGIFKDMAVRVKLEKRRAYREGLASLQLFF